MGKFYRAALACLYLLQVVIILRHPLLRTIEHVMAVGNQSHIVPSAQSDGLPVLVKQVPSQREQSHPAVTAAEPRDGDLKPVVRDGHDSANETHPTEHKDRIRRHRRAPLVEYLVANLARATRRIRPTAAAPPHSGLQALRRLIYATA